MVILVTGIFYGAGKFVNYTYTENILVALPGFTEVDYTGQLTSKDFNESVMENLNVSLLQKQDLDFYHKHKVNRDILPYIKKNVSLSYSDKAEKLGLLYVKVKAIKPGLGDDLAPVIASYFNDLPEFRRENKYYSKVMEDKESTLKHYIDSFEISRNVISKNLGLPGTANIMFNPMEIDEKLLMMKAKYEQVKWLNSKGHLYDQISSPAEAMHADKPIRLMITIAGFVLGLFIASMVVVLVEISSNKSEAEKL